MHRFVRIGAFFVFTLLITFCPNIVKTSKNTALSHILYIVPLLTENVITQFQKQKNINERIA